MVFSDSIKAPAEKDSVTGDKISVIDFSEYNSEGEYVIKAVGTIPDLLDEVSWALDWLLKMQREDGLCIIKYPRKSGSEKIYRITIRPRVTFLILAALHSISFTFTLGRNPLNLSQVTGVGSAPVQHPYHQLSEMGNFNEPIPGMLVGGQITIGC